MTTDTSARPTARGRGRPKRVDDATQRTRVAAVAREMFLEAGYDETTMDAVAQRAGISKKTLYQLFESKDAVFAAIIEAHRELMLDIPSGDDDRPLAEALAAIFRVDLAPEAERARTAVLRLVVDVARRRPELARVLHRHGPEESRRMLAGWIARQAARDRLVADDPNRVAGILLHMVFAPIAFEDDGPRWPAAGARKAHVMAAVEIFLHGVAPRRSPD